MEDSEEQAEKVGAGGTAGIPAVTVDWLLEVWKRSIERDRVALAGLQSRIEGLVVEAVVQVRREVRGQLAHELLPLIQTMHEKVRSLQVQDPDSLVAQGLLADLRTILMVMARQPEHPGGDDVGSKVVLLHP